MSANVYFNTSQNIPDPMLYAVKQIELSEKIKYFIVILNILISCIFLQIEIFISALSRGRLSGLFRLMKNSTCYPVSAFRTSRTPRPPLYNLPMSWTDCHTSLSDVNTGLQVRL
jgi:hypothetical protein